MSVSIPKELQGLLDAALAARKNSYSPYSGAKVGAAVLVKSGRIFGGCNVENSTYGATVCAERVAVAKAVSELGKIEITDVMVVTEADPPWPPCGICRQVIGEFGPKAVIHMANLSGKLCSMKLEELLPLAFTPAHLEEITRKS
jgi:cytidine deaminase